MYENGLNRPTHNYKITDPAVQDFDGLNAANAAAHRNSAAASISYPEVANYSAELLTETHYDDYAGLPQGLFSSLYNSGYGNYLTASATAPDYAEPLAMSTATKGAVTWTKVKVLGENKYIVSCTIYDVKGRAIQVQAVNYTAGLDVVTTQYSFSGQVLRSHLRHENKQGTVQAYHVGTKNNYDALGRLTGIEKNINGSGWKVISRLEYDALGQPKTKKLGEDPHSAQTPKAPLETMQFDYNIRGWLLGANRADLAANGSSVGRFAYELGYDKQTNASGELFNGAAYNGNISGMIWKTAGDGVRRKYDYSYDAANRLLQGLFEQNNADNSWSNAEMRYDVVMGDGVNPTSAYDANGNIKRMQQWGWKITGNEKIDDLQYAYFNGGNKLQSVAEAGTGMVAHGLGDFTDKNTGSDDYGYDLNGNLVTDKNKKLGSVTGVNVSSGGAISYNHLNLPQSIAAKKDDGTTEKGTISYTYDAAGNKLKKTVVEKNISTPGGPQEITTTTTYVGPFVYESKTYTPDYGQVSYSDRLQFFAHEEGRVRPTTNMQQPFVYDFMLKDHLGNVRMVLTDEVKLDAYPVASLEANSLTTEGSFYEGLNIGRVNKSTVPGGYPTDNYTPTNDFIQKLNGNGSKTGVNIVLKVMAGDKFNLHAKSFWRSLEPPGNPVSPLNELVTALSNSIAPLSGGKATISDLSGGVISPQATGFLNSQNTYNTNKPKAFVNWVLFDEQFKYVSAGSGFQQVGGSGDLTPHTLNGQPITRNGYLYVYVSNETPNIDVFFDNLQVTHIRGTILEETHYYPFGLTMAGISSKAAGGVENRKKFNGGTEFTTDLDLSWYETSWRGYDPQLGRFHQIDMLAHTTPDYSPYAFVQNNPILFFDPLGLDTVRVNGGGSHKIKVRQGDVLSWTIGETTSYYTYDPGNKNAVGGFVGGGMDGGTMENFTVSATAKPKQATDFSMLSSWQTGVGATGLGLDAYSNFGRYGDYMYRNSAGVVQSAFQTKYGSGRGPANIGNIKNYSANAQSAIRTTKFLRGASRTVIAAGFLMDWGQVVYAKQTGDPNTSVYVVKASANTVMTVVGFIPGVGWIVSGTYFLGDTFIPGGWPAAIEAGHRNTLQNREVIPNWNPRPGGGLGN